MHQRWILLIVALLVMSCAISYRPVIEDGRYTDPQFGISFSLPASWTVMDQQPDWVQQHLDRIYVKPKLVLTSDNETCVIIYTTGKLNVSAEDVNKFPEGFGNHITLIGRAKPQESIHAGTTNLHL